MSVPIVWRTFSADCSPGAADHRGDVLHGPHLVPGKVAQGRTFGVGDRDATERVEQGGELGGLRRG